MHEQRNKRGKLPPRDELVPINTAKRSFADYNPYRFLKIYQDDDPTFGNVEFFEHYPVFEVPSDQRDQLYVVRSAHEHRLDLIAWEVYGSHLWWWVIYISQDPPLEDPIKDIVAGKILRIPFLPNVILLMR